MKTNEEQQAEYLITGAVSSDDAVIAKALDILRQRFAHGATILDTTTTWQYLTLELAGNEREVFSAIFLDTRHRVIAFEELFSGTLDGASVYPREVVKRALALNAAAVIFAHNHPSGVAEPSAADRALTHRLVAALALVEVRVLDHFVVGEGEPVSFAERGLI